jgi:hypothetical protein
MQTFKLPQGTTIEAYPEVMRVAYPDTIGLRVLSGGAFRPFSWAMFGLR